MRSFWQYIFQSIAQVFYPHTCACCGKVMDEATPFCPSCLRQLPRTEQASHRDNITEQCFSRRVDRFERGAAFLYYDKQNPIRQAIHTMKYYERPDIASFLARQAAYDFLSSDFFEGIDIIIPVPLHPKRLRERGFNQSEYIARAISEVTNIPVSTTLLTRSRYTHQQARQLRSSRQTNMLNAFLVNHPEELYRKHILLVDDLITTGETMTACIEALRVCRAARFSVFSLCKAR